MMYNYGMGYGFGFGWILQLLIFVAFFLIIWWVIKNSPGLFEKKSDDPMRIIKRRLAEGKITKKEFEELKKEIE